MIERKVLKIRDMQVVVNKRNMRIVGGHQRVDVAVKRWEEFTGQQAKLEEKEDE